MKRLISLALIVTLLLGASGFFVLDFPATANATTTFGYTTVGGSSDPLSGYQSGTRFQAPTTGNILSLSVYLSVAAGNIQLGFYDDVAGKPHTCLATTTSTTATTGWNTLSISSTAVTANSYYWITYESSDSSTTTQYDSGVANQHAHSDSAVTYGTFSTDPFPSSGAYGAFQKSSYATYEESAPSYPSGYSYIMNKTGSNYQMLDGTSFSTLNQGTSSSHVFSLIVGNCTVGSSVYFMDGTYTCDSAWVMNNHNGTTLDFQAGFILTQPSNAQLYALLELGNSSSNIISGLTIDGNVANNGRYGYPSGLWIMGNNNIVQNSTAFNLPCFGITISTTSYLCAGTWQSSNNRIFNCTSYNCGSNAVQLSGYSNNSCINSVLWGCSDVAISTYEFGAVITGNTVLSANGTTGIGGNAGYGIAVEVGGTTGSYSIIRDNIIKNCAIGIAIGTGPTTVTKNYVAYNTVENCSDGIVAYLSSGDVITRNTVTYWGTNWKRAFDISGSTNEIVSFNTISHNTTSNNLGYVLYVESSSFNCSISNNTITTLTATSDYGIAVVASDSNLIEGNNIQATTGVLIASGCLNNKIAGNTLGNCTAQISDSGTGTKINPSSSPTYTLIFCNPFDGSGQRATAYSNITTLTLTGVLNVDGSNVTSPYSLLMNKDHFVYSLSATTSSESLPQTTLTFHSYPALGGSINASTGLFNISDSVTLTATPATNYQFLGWLENGTMLSTSQSYSYTVPDNTNVLTGIFYDPASKTSTDSLFMVTVYVTTITVVLGSSIGLWYYKRRQHKIGS